ncbi:hypothetical protein RSAG8_02827, partial [Rhizoctonia solani AG-8 WAC10335]
MCTVFRRPFCFLPPPVGLGFGLALPAVPSLPHSCIGRLPLPSASWRSPLFIHLVPLRACLLAFRRTDGRGPPSPLSAAPLRIQSLCSSRPPHSIAVTPCCALAAPPSPDHPCRVPWHPPYSYPGPWPTSCLHYPVCTWRSSSPPLRRLPSNGFLLLLLLVAHILSTNPCMYTTPACISTLALYLCRTQPAFWSGLPLFACSSLNMNLKYIYTCT